MKRVVPTLGLCVALWSGSASAGACCLSSSLFGVGRLSVWEEASAGLWGQAVVGLGRWGAEGEYRPFLPGNREDEARLEAQGIVRLAERWEVFARAPWVLGLRTSSSGEQSFGHGLGDVQGGVRWDAIPIGRYVELPGLALTLTVLGPTGRRPEQALDALGASATGRGAFVLGGSVGLERAFLPWFVRLDAGASLPLAFRRADTGALQRYGPGVQAALSGGRELVPDRVVVALQLGVEHEAALRLDEQLVPDSSSTGLPLAASASWKVTPHWTLAGTVSSELLGRLGLARNRSDRLGASLGVRRGFF